MENDQNPIVLILVVDRIIKIRGVYRQQQAKPSVHEDRIFAKMLDMAIDKKNRRWAK